MNKSMPQSGKYLLDTNIVIAMFAGEATIQERRQSTDEVFLPSPVVGELCYGARKSSRPIENLERINRLIQDFQVIPCNLETARWFGIIKDGLRRKGRLIPDNDIWIAAVAMQRGLILATRDSHFDEIESLQTERW